MDRYQILQIYRVMGGIVSQKFEYMLGFGRE
jgi:hypothetical protein